jgi:capsular polysaccharide biosynthesis protein
MTLRPHSSEAPEGAEHDVRRLGRFMRRLVRFWPIVLIGVGASALACSVFLFFRAPKYKSETVLLYSRGVSSADSTDQSTGARNATVRLKELLFSRPNLAGIVAKFGLYREVEREYGPADAAEELKRHIEFRAPGGDTFSIAFQGGSPAEAQQVTTALANVVIEGDAELRKSQAQRAWEFLSSERASKSAELKAAEQRLAAFMGEHRRFALDTTPHAAGAAIRASAAPQPTPGALGGYSTSRATPRLPGATPPPAPGSSPPADAGERSRAVAALAAARANLAEQLVRFSPAHPDARAAQGEVDRATARVAALGPEPVASAPGPAPAPTVASAPDVRPAPRPSAPRPAAVPAASPGKEKDDVVALETEWVKLTREVTTARQRVDQVEAALFKADVLASSERAGRAVEITVIDPAYLPHRPVGLPTSLITAIFVAAGMLLGLLGAALGALLDDRIYSGSDAARVTTVLAQVPKMNFRRRSYAAG